MPLTLLFYIFIIVAAIQIIYYLFFAFFAFSKEKMKELKTDLPVSIIICAKNEAENLKNFLPSILNQNYSDFEIVLINNASYDDTLDVMNQFKSEHDNIKIVDVKNNEAFWGNKKYALTLGIKTATNEHLLFTNANCKPLTKNWITKMTSKFSDEKTIVLGYRKYYPKKFSFINLLARFDELLRTVQSFSIAKLGTPYTGVGENLAYTKSEFYKTNGFINHIKIRFGDDTLFIKDAATSSNTTTSSSMNSFIISQGPQTFKEWYNNKRMHFSISKHYKFSHKLVLGLFFVSKIIFLSLSILLIFIYDWKLILPVIGLYTLVQYIIMGFSAKKFKETQTLILLPLLEVCLILFQFTIFMVNRFLKPIDWK